MRLGGQLKYLLLALVLVLFSASVFVNLLELQEKGDRLTQDEREAAYRDVSLAQVEFFQFLDTLQRFRDQDGTVTKRDVVSRFEALENRFTYLRQSAVGGLIMEVPDGRRHLDDLAGRMAGLSSLIANLSPSDTGTYRMLRPRLADVIVPLQGLSRAVGQVQDAQAAERRKRGTRAYWTVLTSLVGFIVCAAILVVMMAQQQRRAATLAKAAEEAREAADMAHATLVDSIEAMGEGIAIFDAEDRLQLFNEPYQALFPGAGYAVQLDATFESILRAAVEAGVYGFDGETHDNATAVEAFVAERLARHADPGAPYEEQLADGRWLRVSERRTLDGFTIAIATDISELKWREVQLSELAEENARFATAIDAASSGIAIVDATSPGNPLVFVNPAFGAITGYRPEECLGRSLDMLNGPDTDPEAADRAAQAFRSAAPVHVQLKQYMRDGDSFWSDLTISPIFADGYAYAYVVILTDVTDRKRIEADLLTAKEQAEAANQAKSAFLAVMSHEVRTPLNGVLGTLGVLSETALDHDQKLLVTTAKQSGEALLVILNDILDSSKLEAGKLELEIIDFNPAEIIGGVANLVVPRARAKRLEIVSAVDPLLPNVLRGDPGRIRQVLLNLCDNAVKFTAKGKIVIEAKLAGIWPGRATVRFEVTDTGIGMSPEQRARLFDPFSQGDASISRRFGGTGLGLSICRQLVELMKGRIGAISAPGRGTTMWMEIPFDLGNVSPVHDRLQELAPTPSEVGRTNIRVLLAEDNPTNAFVLKAMLTGTGYQLDIVGNGLEAVESARTLPYDVILMDVSMPEMDGLEATQAIRRLPDRARARTPIVAMTALAMSGDRERCLAAGMNDYLPKPIDRKALLRALAHWSRLDRSLPEPAMLEPPMPEPAIPEPAIQEPGAPEPAAPMAGATATEQPALPEPAPAREPPEAAAAVPAPPPLQAPGARSESPMLDAAVLNQLVAETGKESAPMLLDVFVEDCRSRLERILSAAGAADAQILQQEAHALVSSAATFGAMAMSDRARAIEQAVREQRTPDAIMLAEGMKDLADATFAALDAAKLQLAA